MNYGWVILAICLISITISYGIRLSFGVFFKSLEEEFTWTRALTSSVFSVYMLLGCLFAIIGGWVADRYGPKIVFLATGLFCFIGLGLASQAVAPWQMFFCYSVLVAAGTGPTYIVATSIATRWFSQRRGLALATVTSGVGLGSILVAPIAAYLIVDYGWRMSYLIIGVVALILMIPLSLLLKRPPGDIVNVSKSSEPAALTVLASDKSNDGQDELSLSQIIKKRNFSLLLSIWFFYAFCIFMVTTHIVRYAIDLDISPLQAASLISLSGFANIPARIITGMVSDRFGRKLVALICASIMAVSMLLLTQSSSLWSLYIFAVVFGAAYGGLSPPSTAMVGDSFGTRHIGLVFGLLDVGWVCGAAAGPALAGYIFDTNGNYYLAFFIGILSALVIVVLLLFMKASKPKNRK